MWLLLVLFVLGSSNASPSDRDRDSTESQYTLLAASKDYERHPSGAAAAGAITTNTKPQFWRRHGLLPGPAGSQGLPLIVHLLSVPGLLMVGVNLGAFLCMVLALLGLVQPRTWATASPISDFYAYKRQSLDRVGGKEAVYS